MNDKGWYWKSPIGVIYIVWLPRERRWGTYFDGTVWESCDDPVANADNIAQHVSGCPDWDLSPYTAPSDLSGWHPLK